MVLSRHPRTQRMCGIFGAVALAPGLAPFTERDLAPMAVALAHRGPDGSAVAAMDFAALGMTRLGIVAPHEPPMVYHHALATAPSRRHRSKATDASVAAVQNGEIYNHQELRELLARRGIRPASQTDTALIPALFASQGPKFVELLRGPYAIAVADARTRSVHLYRGRLGEKPLFYAVRRQTLWFASEAKALVAAGAVGVEAEPQRAARFLWRGVLDEDEPLLAGVQVLPPGSHLEASPTGVRLESTWQLAAFAGALDSSPATLVDRLAAAFCDAVALRAPTAVKSAVLLSGGLDSSLVAVAARPYVHDAYTLRVRGADETRKAARVAASHEFAWHCVPAHLPSPPELARLLWHLEVPDASTAFGSAAAFAQLALRLRADGVRVVLCGEGADEVFLGYPWDLAAAALEHDWPLSPQSEACRLLGPNAHLLLGLARVSLCGRDRARARDCWLAAVDGEQRAVLRAEARQLLTPALREALVPHDAARDELRRAPPYPPARGRQLAGLGLDMLSLPVLHADRLLMAHGVEARLPFLDHRLVELALAAPADLLERPGLDKPLLREVARRLLPRGARPPRKRGFAAPARPSPRAIVALARQLGRAPGIAIEATALARAAKQTETRAHVELLWRAVLLETTLRALADGPEAVFPSGALPA